MWKGDVVMCRKNGGQFIPCRGGGTATTYYTDEHNVDEEVMTIADYGGHWEYGSGEGIFDRYLCIYSLTAGIDLVASRLIYLS